jgi:serine protease Do
MTKRNISFISFLLVLVFTFSGCAAPSLSKVSTIAPPLSVTSPVIAESASSGSVTDFEATLENIYTKVNPSVVNIRVVQKQEVTFPALPEIPGFPFFNTPQGPQEYYSSGLGSGFVWDKAGDIVTNNHVISGADSISVTFEDGTAVSGKVIGYRQSVWSPGHHDGRFCQCTGEASACQRPDYRRLDV